MCECECVNVCITWCLCIRLWFVWACVHVCLCLANNTTIQWTSHCLHIVFVAIDVIVNGSKREIPGFSCLEPSAGGGVGKAERWKRLTKLTKWRSCMPALCKSHKRTYKYTVGNAINKHPRLTSSAVWNVQKSFGIISPEKTREITNCERN